LLRGAHTVGVGTAQRGDAALLDLVRYCDKDVVSIFIPSQSGFGDGIELTTYNHRLGKCPVRVVLRSQWDDEMRGQWDSVIWVQLARSRMALYALEAVDKAVQAPMMLPTDVQDVPVGGDGIMYTDHPEKAGRLPLEIPQGAFAELANLGNEMRQGGRSPEGRSSSASVITGRGVQELNAGFDSQIKTIQDAMAEALTDVLGLCFLMDETYWPNKSKTIRGTAEDSPYEVTYVPAKDINGDHSIDVTYGFAAGMDPNRTAVMLLQLHGVEAISRNFLLRQMPFSINVEEEFATRDVEDLRGAAKQAIAGLAAGVPQLMAQGQDPSQILAKLSEVIALRQKGEQVEAALAKVFAPPPAPPPAPGGAATPGESATAPGAGAAPGAVA
jgi:predicted RNase H-like HicB family nuclease